MITSLRRALALSVAFALGSPATALAAVAPAEPTALADAEPGDEATGEPEPDGTTEPAEPTPKSPEDALVEEAMRHFIECRRLYDSGEYLDAAAECERSYAAVRAGRTLHGLVLAYETGGKPVEALRNANKYLKLPDCRSGPGLHCAERRDEVEKAAERLRLRVGTLELAIEPGVKLKEVRVNQRPIPLADFPLVLEPGPVEVVFLGYSDNERRQTVARLAPGERVKLTAYPFDRPVPNVGPPDNGNGDPPPRVDAARRRQLLRGFFWTGLGLTLASGTSLAVLGPLTVRARDDFFDIHCGEGCVDDDRYPQDEEQRFDRLKIATNTMVGITSALALATVVVGIFAFSRRNSASRRASTFRWEPGGLSLRF